VLLKLFHSIEREELLLNLFYDTSITLLPKYDKNKTTKCCRPLSLTDAKIPNKILANKIYKYATKRVIYHD
jgi:hypothetical protein